MSSILSKKVTFVILIIALTLCVVTETSATPSNFKYSLRRRSFLNKRQAAVNPKTTTFDNQIKSSLPANDDVPISIGIPSGDNQNQTATTPPAASKSLDNGTSPTSSPPAVTKSPDSNTPSSKSPPAATNTPPGSSISPTSSPPAVTKSTDSNTPSIKSPPAVTSTPPGGSISNTGKLPNAPTASTNSQSTPPISPPQTAPTSPPQIQSTPQTTPTPTPPPPPQTTPTPPPQTQPTPPPQTQPTSPPQIQTTSTPQTTSTSPSQTPVSPTANANPTSPQQGTNAPTKLVTITSTVPAKTVQITTVLDNGSTSIKKSVVPQSTVVVVTKVGIPQGTESPSSTDNGFDSSGNNHYSTIYHQFYLIALSTLSIIFISTVIFI